MDIIRYSIGKPVTVVSIIVIVVLFGLISLNRLPLQLSPTVIEPEVKVSTTWHAFLRVSEMLVSILSQIAPLALFLGVLTLWGCGPLC